MLGDAGVGKTFLLHRFIGKKIDDALLPTISVEYADKMVELPSGQQIKAELWDTGKFCSFITLTMGFE